MAQGVLVFAEQVDGSFRKIAYEAVSEGRRLADTLGDTVSAVVFGSGVDGIAGELAQYGADKIFVGDDPALADYTTDAYTNMLFEVVKVRKMQLGSHDTIHVKSDLCQHAADRSQNSTGFLPHISKHFLTFRKISSHQARKISITIIRDDLTITYEQRPI